MLHCCTDNEVDTLTHVSAVHCVRDRIASKLKAHARARVESAIPLVAA